MAKLIDTNVILRYVLEDDPVQAEEARQTIQEGAYTTAEVLAEVTYVLRRVYGAKKAEVTELLYGILEEIEVEDVNLYRTVFNLYRDTNLDFVDCILVAKHRVYGEEVFSFDKKLIDTPHA